MSSILRPLQLDEPSSESPRVLAKSRRASSVEKPTTAEPQFRPSRLQRELSKPSFTPPPLPDFVALIPWKAYLLHLPVLLLGLMAYAGVIYIFTWIEPRSIQNVVVPNSYAPLLVVAALGHFFCFSFLFLNARRGLLASLLFTALLFLRLQQVLTWPITFWAVVAVVGVELVWVLIRKFVWQFRRKVRDKGFPNMPKLPSVRSKHKDRKELPTDLADTAHSKTVIEGQKSSHRRHGRKRQHHFFGK